jgi:thioredoxin reductase
MASRTQLGASGNAASGEAQAASRVHYGIADPLGRHRARYAGRRVAVVGSGHSAFDVLIDLAELADSAGTEITWIVRRSIRRREVRRRGERRPPGAR